MLDTTPDRTRYTPTQCRILAVLADGKLHSRDELFACLNDDMTNLTCLRVHLAYLRKKMEQIGETIKTVKFHDRGQGNWYQHVRLVGSNPDRGPNLDENSEE